MTDEEFQRYVNRVNKRRRRGHLTDYEVDLAEARRRRAMLPKSDTAELAPLTAKQVSLMLKLDLCTRH